MMLRLLALAGCLLSMPVAAANPEEPRAGVEHAAAPVLEAGSGSFVMRTGPGGSRTVEVFYHRPSRLQEHSPVLIVLPGAGRNAWTYRDHWIDASERHGVLVLSPHYSEEAYPRFWNYNLAGMLDDVVIDREARAMTDYRIVADRARWLFGDMDLIFTAAVRAAGLETGRYDLFGHSAGGQFLHRFALFAEEGTRADRILASNAGWYTVPEWGVRFPFGLEDAPIDARGLATGFARRLVVFLGELDDASETRGDLVRSQETDRQGLHRLARGRHFHEQARRTAADMGLRFEWTLEVVPGVGHDPKRMGEAAAEYLYGAPGRPAGAEATAREAEGSRPPDR